METRKFLNQYQPQTLQSATILLYLNAVFALFNPSVITLFILAGAGGAYGIANDKKWGYFVGLLAAIVPLALTLLIILTSGLKFDIGINLIFELILLAVLLHPLSKNYVKTWFK